MPLQIELVVRGAASGPSGPDITDWMQATGSLIAVIAVAAVAFIEHRRAKKAEAAASQAPLKADVAVLNAFLDILQRCEGVWLKDYEEFVQSVRSGKTNTAPFAHSWATAHRLKEVLDRLLAGQVLPVPTLLIGAEISSTLVWERADRSFGTVDSARIHARVYVAIFRLLYLRAEHRLSELRDGSQGDSQPDDGEAAGQYADSKLSQIAV